MLVHIEKVTKGRCEECHTRNPRAEACLVADTEWAEVPVIGRAVYMTLCMDCILNEAQRRLENEFESKAVVFEGEE